MAKGRRPWAAELLRYWFHELEPSDWFGSSAAIDRELTVRFERKVIALGAQPATDFIGDSQLAQAAILLFDQVPRNIFRDTAKAFAYDPLALEICKHMIAEGWDANLPDRERQFVAMPLMHSEDMADQEASLAYFGKHLPDNVSFARSHHEMIARFGRFPHRNDVLGRETTSEEQKAIEEGFSW